eukprot:scaffold5074_cov127-Isochrysis_galbana.AAC.1
MVAAATAASLASFWASILATTAAFLASFLDDLCVRSLSRNFASASLSTFHARLARALAARGWRSDIAGAGRPARRRPGGRGVGGDTAGGGTIAESFFLGYMLQ